MVAHPPHGRARAVILLCRAEELKRTGARSVVLGKGVNALDIVIVEADGARHAYINCCPHQFIPLETFPDYFFDEKRELLVCSGHGARFEPDTGRCVEGPCQGESLDRLNIVEKDGAVYLDESRAPEAIARAKRAKRNW